MKEVHSPIQDIDQPAAVTRTTETKYSNVNNEATRVNDKEVNCHLVCLFSDHFHRPPDSHPHGEDHFEFAPLLAFVGNAVDQG